MASPGVKKIVVKEAYANLESGIFLHRDFIWFFRQRGT